MGNWCEIYGTGLGPKGGYGIQLPGLDMPTKILTAVDTVRNTTNGMRGIIQGRIGGAAEPRRNPKPLLASQRRITRRTAANPIYPILQDDPLPLDPRFQRLEVDFIRHLRTLFYPVAQVD